MSESSNVGRHLIPCPCCVPCPVAVVGNTIFGVLRQPFRRSTINLPADRRGGSSGICNRLNEIITRRNELIRTGWNDSPGPAVARLAVATARGTGLALPLRGPLFSEVSPPKRCWELRPGSGMSYPSLPRVGELYMRLFANYYYVACGFICNVLNRRRRDYVYLAHYVRNLTAVSISSQMLGSQIQHGD